MNDIAIKVQNLSKCYHIYDAPRDRLKQFVVPRLQRMVGQLPKQYFREFWALKDVSFEIKKGETFGIIGRNGSGKSTLLQMICGTLNPIGGSIQTNGRIAALLELGSGFNPDFTGRENVDMNDTALADCPPLMHRCLLNSSSRQGLPGSRSHGWQHQTRRPFFRHIKSLLIYFSHPCVLDSGNPCRNDGDITCVDSYL